MQVISDKSRLEIAPSEVYIYASLLLGYITIFGIVLLLPFDDCIKVINET